MRARAAVWLAVTLAAISLWMAAAPVAVRIFGRGEVSASDFAAPDDRAPPRSVDLGPVLDFAPFGRAEGVEPSASAADAELALTLLGITMAEPPGSSRAILSGGAVAVANYGVGDVIREGVTLEAVQSDHVMIRISGQDHVLAFAKGDAAAAVNLADQAGPADDAYAEPPEEAPADAPEAEALLGQYRAEVQQDPAGLVLRLGLEPGAGGYLVTDAASDVLLQAGLQPGDVLGSVNGTPLGDPVRDAALFDVIASVGLANLTVLRGGETILMTFPLP